MAAAQAFFTAALNGTQGHQAQTYLATRGFDAHTISRFGFGYAPEGRQSLKEALTQFPEEKLIEAGLRIQVEDKEPYDRFRGRLMLPIEDARGRVIAFGGRILDSAKTDAPKYLNSPDTPLFDKGRTLYNLHRAGPASRQSGRIIVVEGYMDVIALAAAGIADAVAPLGTALTERQIEMLWRLVEAPVLCFDGDAAGQRAAMRAITRALPMLRPAHTLRICRLPAGLDPDDLIKQQGVGAMERALDGARSLIETLWENERDALPLTTPEDKAGLKARLMVHVETIADPDIKALYRRELTERFSAFAFPPREQREFVPQRRGGFQRAPAIAPPAPETARRLHKATGQGRRDALGAAVIAGLVRYPQVLVRHIEALSRARLNDRGQMRALDALLDHADHGEALDSAALVTTLTVQGLAAAAPEDVAGLHFGFLAPEAEPAAAMEELAEAVALLVERPALEAALADATARFEADPEGAFAEQQRLLKRKLEFEERLRQMASARMAPPVATGPEGTTD